MAVQWKHAFRGFFSLPLGTGILLGILYWFIEAFVHDLCFGEGPILMQIFHPNAHEIWMRLIVAALLIIFGFHSQNMINQRRRVELALIEREKEAQRILENNPAAIVLIDCETRQIAYANCNAAKMIGDAPDAICGMQCHRYLCPRDENHCPVLDMGHRMDISERELFTAKRESVPVLKSVAKVQFKGKPHLLEAFFDITEQKKMQRAIQHAHAELNQIFQTASVGMRLIDCDFNILKINRAFCDLCGRSPEEAVGRKCFDVFSGSMCFSDDCPLTRVLSGKDLEKDYEVIKHGADGSSITCNLTVSRFDGPNGLIGIVEAFKDITELKRTQSELEAERDRLHRILFHQFENVGIVNDRYLLEYQNELLKQHSNGRSPCYCYQVLRDMDAPCEECLMQKALETGKIQRFEFDNASGRSFQHTYTPFVDNNGQKKALVSQRDISERKASVAAAIRSEHLAAIGELAAGVAHEINNPINGIINYGQILVNRTHPGELLNDISRHIIEEGDRIAAIVASLLSFSRQDTERPDVVEVTALIEDSLTLTGAQLRKDGIHLEVNSTDHLPPIAGRPQEIQQVFLNIINNGRYALNEKYPDGGDQKKMTIDVSKVKNGCGDAVRISFTDFGTGIPGQALERVVNPFFSTKPKGKGTGLGLSISHRIVENHGGKMTIDSVPGAFTRVMVDFPERFAN